MQILILQGLLEWFNKCNINKGDNGYNEIVGLYKFVETHFIKVCCFYYMFFDKNDNSRPLDNYLGTNEIYQALLSKIAPTGEPLQIPIPDSILQALEHEKMRTSREPPLQWSKKKIALCVYFVDCYFGKSNPNDLWATGENLFNVSNLRQAKNNYLNNKNTDGKPKTTK
jgi:hypothetical protein